MLEPAKELKVVAPTRQYLTGGIYEVVAPNGFLEKISVLVSRGTLTNNFAGK